MNMDIFSNQKKNSLMYNSHVWERGIGEEDYIKGIFNKNKPLSEEMIYSNH